ncbi:hypothetical protein MA16_Dca014136 [Dendrobium catenatum]|uniref:Uncharacterized protein n=1 Tax=Dendrobium catenatum TaxID=906689 RepID=A0A2I0VTG8_9ASPA|nr:hypothetical protein MA16_Dca014136 [Dendrobium catenatum]
MWERCETEKVRCIRVTQRREVSSQLVVINIGRVLVYTYVVQYMSACESSSNHYVTLCTIQFSLLPNPSLNCDEQDETILSI